MQPILLKPALLGNDHHGGTGMKPSFGLQPEGTFLSVASCHQVTVHYVAMRQLVLHLGAPKTATKLIQKALRADEQPLVDAGVRVLRRDDYDELGGGAARSWRRGRGKIAKLDNVGRALGDLLSQHNQVVVSHEDFLGTIASFRRGMELYPDAVEVLERVVSQSKATSVIVILYVRSPDRYVESVYLQLVRSGITMPFEEWVEPVHAAQLSWLNLIERVRSAVGSKPTVRYFEDIKAGAGAYVTDFYEAAALPMEPRLRFKMDSQNRGYSDAAMRIALTANGVLEGHDRLMLRRFLDKNFSNVTHPPPALLDYEKRVQWLNELSDDHCALHREYRPSGATNSPYIDRLS